jgi:hypothetical protein
MKRSSHPNSERRILRLRNQGKTGERGNVKLENRTKTAEIGEKRGKGGKNEFCFFADQLIGRPYDHTKPEIDTQPPDLSPAQLASDNPFNNSDFRSP